MWVASPCQGTEWGGTTAGPEPLFMLHERSNGSHGRCVRRGGKRAMYAFKKPSVATEWIRTIRTGVEAGAGKQPEVFGGLDRSWSARCREGGGFRE